MCRYLQVALLATATPPVASLAALASSCHLSVCTLTSDTVYIHVPVICLMDRLLTVKISFLPSLAAPIYFQCLLWRWSWWSPAVPEVRNQCWCTRPSKPYYISFHSLLTAGIHSASDWSYSCFPLCSCLSIFCKPISIILLIYNITLKHAQSTGAQNHSAICIYSQCSQCRLTIVLQISWKEVYCGHTQ